MTTDGNTAARRRLTDDLKKAGIRQGCPLLIHTSLSALGHVEGGANTVIDALLDAVGPEGTLVIPTLSYLYTNAESPTFDVAKTPTNLGTIPETFRLRHGVARSMHPTHSCAAVGPQTLAVLGEHRHDRSPVGENSPFRKVRDLDGQVAFLGVPHGARCNTSMHGVEELLDPPPPYLFQDETMTYTLIDTHGSTEVVTHKRHGFGHHGQRYERVIDLMPAGTHCSGMVGDATLHVFEARAMWDAALAALQKDPLCLVDEIIPGSEGHHIVRGATGKARYRVGWESAEEGGAPSGCTWVTMVGAAALALGIVTGKISAHNAVGN